MVNKSEQKLSQFQYVSTAFSIYCRVLNICLRMPKRYTYLVLQSILSLAGEIADYTRKADSVKEFNSILQIEYLEHAVASIDALDQRISFFLIYPNSLRPQIDKKSFGITDNELQQLSDDMVKEKNYIVSIIKEHLS